MVPASIQDRIERAIRHLERLKGIVDETVRVYSDEKGYAYVSRLKQPNSIAEKIETGRYRSWSDLDDLFACTIVVPTLVEEPQVLEYLRTVFQEYKVRRRGQAAKSPEVFRFDSTRFIGRLRNPGSVHPAEVASLLFEVQVRTAFEHAWSVTTHRLTYKGAEVDWRRFRLAAQLKAAVEQLDLMIVGFDEASQHVAEHDWFSVTARSRIVNIFKPLFAQGRLPAELLPKDWSRFSDNLFSLLMASPTAPRTNNERLDFIGNCIETTTSIMKETEPRSVPRSLSLHQWTFALLVGRDLVVAPLDGYTPAITPELASLFPEMKQFPSAFQIDL